MASRQQRIDERTHHHDLTAEYHSSLEKWIGNGVFQGSDEAFIDLVAACVPHDGTRVLLHPDVLHQLRDMHDIRPLNYTKAELRFREIKEVWWPTIHKAVLDLPAPPLVRPRPQSSTELMEKTFAPPVMFVDQFLLHGMTLLAGKRKKGKSTMALELALSIAVGRKAFGHLSTQACKVLYISLEDNEELINLRLHAIQPNFTGNPNLQFIYQFPPLDTPETPQFFREYIEEGYRVFFLDVLGRVLPSGKRERKNTDEYREFTELLGPLQLLANEHRIALVILDHLRKSEADDPFDAIHGSGAKTAVADHLMVFDRRFKEKDATIQISSRRLGEDTVKITLVDGHLEFLGRGEDFELNQEESRVAKIIQEENRPLGVKDLMQAMGIPLSQYPRFRVAINRMFHKGILGKTKRGLYTVGTIRQEEDDAGEVPL